MGLIFQILYCARVLYQARAKCFTGTNPSDPHNNHMIEHSLIHTFIYSTNTYGAQAMGQAVCGLLGRRLREYFQGWWHLSWHLKTEEQLIRHRGEGRMAFADVLCWEGWPAQGTERKAAPCSRGGQRELMLDEMQGWTGHLGRGCLSGERFWPLFWNPMEALTAFAFPRRSPWLQ